MKKLLFTVATLLSLNAVAQQCNYRTNEVDEFTGTSKKVTVDQIYVEHTDSLLQKYYKNKNYFELNTYCAKINDTRVVYFFVTIQTEDAYKYYGAMQSDAKLIFKLKDGSTVTLLNAKFETSDADYTKKISTYSFYAIVEEAAYKSLTEQPAEKIRIYWSKGYEDYVVDYPEVLINQLNCVK